MPANTVKVDRTTLFGNPFSVKEYGHDRAVALHRAWLTGESVGKGLSKELLQRRKTVLGPCLRCAARTWRAGVRCPNTGNATAATRHCC
jgi:hypothetical protein